MSRVSFALECLPRAHARASLTLLPRARRKMEEGAATSGESSFSFASSEEMMQRRHFPGKEKTIAGGLMRAGDGQFTQLRAADRNLPPQPD